MRLTPSLIVLTFALAGANMAAPQADVIAAKLTGPWRIEIGPDSVDVAGTRISVRERTVLEIPRVEIVQVCDEMHPRLPVFKTRGGGWARGPKLRKLRTQECTAWGTLIADSVRVKPKAGDAQPFVCGRDYDLEREWGTFGRLEGGAIAPKQKVFVDYDYGPYRLDSVAVDEHGKARLVVGKPGVGVILPPELAEGERSIMNIWVTGRTEKLTPENLYPIHFGLAKAKTPKPSNAECLLPKTLAKLRSGEPLTIVAWGDSVTNGGGVGRAKELWYQHRFVALLRERFPQANITLKTAAWPGGNSRGYMGAAPGGKYDFKRDVLDPKPDLVTIEFVNDAYLNEEATQKHYDKIMAHLNGIPAEVILITPHFVRPDWMRLKTMKPKADPRLYVKGLKRFAAERKIALADASASWCQLWKQGLPYITLEANSINHPDARGHEIFAQALMALFPDE